MTMQAESTVLVAAHDGTAFVRVVGRGGYRHSHALREFAERRIAEGVRSFVFDLGECRALDSTFMGLMAMLVVKHRAPAVSVVVVNAAVKVARQIEDLGLGGLFAFAAPPAGEEPWRTLAPAGDAAASGAARRTMIEAHETLGAVAEANVARFRDVLACLREEGDDADG
jgi:anti-anti-sigma regulatory factor